jgi:hypothetical protein
MLNFLTANLPSKGKVLSRLAGALLAGLAQQPATAHSSEVNPRDFQAFGYRIHVPGESRDVWRKPNGGEILGGFYGADDEVNDRTGEIRRR